MKYTQRQVDFHEDNRGLQGHRCSAAVEAEVMAMPAYSCDSPVLYDQRSRMFYFLNTDGRPEYLERESVHTMPLRDASVDRDYIDELPAGVVQRVGQWSGPSA